MSALLTIAIAGWGSSAALALVLAHRRAAAFTRGERLAAVVHELRGPLQAAGLILAGAQRGADAGTAPTLAALEVELGRATLAVGDLGGDRGRAPTVTPACDATALIGALAPGWRLVATARGRDVRVVVPDRPLWARVERLRLAQALGNLVANALEHGDGPVEVRLAEGRDGGVRTEVLDGGAGLPASVTALVARPPDPARPRGRGLGIAAGVAADAGGRLWSAPAACGTRLVLQVPRMSSPPADSAEPYAS